ncbi:MAG: ATP synthase F1 subunit gamma [Planctomycetes bacterium]|nr:ATP synthase F1 subunit gamma [Planctomycetota bacterium]
MATSRELRNKINSVKNTKKITRTMEMIATAKSVVCQKRIEAVQPYGNKVAELLDDLKKAGAGGDELAAKFPLLRVPAKAEREALFVITANRGLCGGYNANTLKLAEMHIREQRARGVDVEVHMIGKKGAARFRYLGREVSKVYIDFDDRPTFSQAEAILDPVLDRFAGGELDAVTIVSTRYLNAARQAPEKRHILPLSTGGEAASGAHGSTDFLFEPSPEEILGTLVPMTLKMQLFQALVEAAASEQIARRIAMKNATDNADEMIRTYTMLYNRTRQAGITQEILEIVGGAEALA